MAFIETRFPDDISLGATGGPGFDTEVITVNSGSEQRNSIWQDARGMWDVSHGVRSDTQLATLIAFFRVVKGRAKGFRFKDWQDYRVTTSNGVMGSAGVGDGTPAYQLQKTYTLAGNTEYREITKPVSGSTAVYRGGVLKTAGAGAGNYALDTTTGIVTWVADASSNASSITVGATTQVVLAANPGTLIAGQKLYLSGFAGAHAADVNSLAHTINSVTGSGPYTFTLATNTAGRTITLGTGAGKKYPQASEALTWSGDFDVPCRFDTDQMRTSILTSWLHSWGNIPVVETRDIV